MKDISIIEKVIRAMSDKEDKLFKRREIIDLVIRNFPGTNPESVQPSDYCYNIINNF